MIRPVLDRLLFKIGATVAWAASLAAGPDRSAAGLARDTRIQTWPAVAPVAIGREPQLFIDNYLIAEHNGLTRTTHPPRRALDRPILGWEQGTTQPYVTVVRDPETRKFRMWYNKYIGEECSIAYAESDDGIRWETPGLGILGDDNRVLKISVPGRGGYGVSLIDEGPAFTDKARRFKLAWWGTGSSANARAGKDLGASLCVAFSPDGLRWTPWPHNPVLAGVDDIVDVFWDPIRRRYGAFFKTHADAEDGYTPGIRAGGSFRRLVSASASDDFTNWQTPWRVLMPEPRDEGQLEFYSVGGTIARGCLLIGFARMLHDDYPADEVGPPGRAAAGSSPTSGIGYATLVTSRDGLLWERQDDIFFDRNPDPEAWDRAMTWIGSALPMDGELYIYYGGYKRGHKIEPTRERQLGLAKMPMDRFVSRDATGARPGRILTVPLRLPEGGTHRLLLNASGTAGRIRVQLRDAKSGDVLPGYGLDDCTPIQGDGPALPAVWKEKKELPKGTVRIEMEIARAGIFGFSAVPVEGGAGEGSAQGTRNPDHREDGAPLASRDIQVQTRPAVAPMAIDIGDRKQLFIDGRFVGRSQDVRIAMNPPVKAGIVLECDRPWEDFRLTSYFTVVQDGELCRMYYSCFSKDQWHTPGAWDKHAYLCYAESRDGIHWEKPDLGIVEFEGSRSNNILARSVVDGTVFIDPRAAADRRYKLLSTVGPHRGGLRVSYSADGIHFTTPADPVSAWTPDSQQNAFWDDRIGKYVAYLRGRPEMGFEPRNRLVVRVEVDDLEKSWDARPQIVLSTDAHDPPDVDFYTNACARYRWADDAYFMFPALYHHFPPELGNDGLLEVSLAASRDGIEWKRPDRRPYVPLGLRGEWDAFFVMMGVGMVRRGDAIYQYYNGVDLTHGGTRRMSDEDRKKWRRWSKIGRVLQRLDGFCSADADYGGGWLETPPIIFAGDRLVLNLNTSAAGAARVGITDAGGKSVPGRSIDECDEIMANSTEHTVAWKGKTGVGDLAGRPVRLRFEMRSAKLHAFRFRH